jgi:hypothetical protein
MSQLRRKVQYTEHYVEANDGCELRVEDYGVTLEYNDGGHQHGEDQELLVLVLTLLSVNVHHALTNFVASWFYRICSSFQENCPYTDRRGPPV